MAEGDLTKERTLNKIEIVSDWVIQIREIDGVYEEQKDGSKKLISSNYHRRSLVPYLSLKEKVLQKLVGIAILKQRIKHLQKVRVYNATIKNRFKSNR